MEHLSNPISPICYTAPLLVQPLGCKLESGMPELVELNISPKPIVGGKTMISASCSPNIFQQNQSNEI